MNRWKPSVLALIAVSAALVIACESKRAPTGSDLPGDAAVGTDKYAAADPKLAKALQAAASNSAASDNGPPPEGVFEPGVADRRHPKNVPAKVELISAGSEPRVIVGSVTEGDAAVPDIARAKSYGPGFVEVSLQRGRNAFPSVDLGLSIGPAKRDEGGFDWIVAEVKRTQLSKSQPGQLPPGIEKEMATLTGTTARVHMTLDGRSGDMQSELAKGALADLQPIAGLLGETLEIATVARPPQPVGVDAQWIAEVRTSLAGIDVMEYRAYRVKGIEGERVHLTVEIRAYVASRDVTFPGAPKDSTVEQFEAEGQGELELVRGEILARQATISERALVFFRLAGEANPRGGQGGPSAGVVPVELRGQLVFARGEDIRAVTKTL
ncbi:MAG: hypothetical protein ABTD50_07585 [Polyangiaceae bacterium]|jgi:hypothetical protein